ncbi:heavy metal translocating P-type ATPase [Moheibacter lacus]|uniref:Heavy metal translocating P-type ATPase metal-binding domain-containing protein n=1 Tax=Moheibacter lacus TaxID=2745851 RepID=A0A838ZR29_9FLAO|nr:heavy metal translocating P-type ATPase metal-binding domain-containing protein [Moheibacter lacus]MBA5628672.1 heavy metal translocating P-type ATPase metal-binding domain-containing protein [Moheibacter lacus]
MAESCFHCGQKIEDEDIHFDQKNFCCVGCKTVYEILNLNGLENFYAMNRDAGIRPDDKANRHFDFLDTPEIFEKVVDFSEDGVTLVKFHIPVIHCTSCVWLLESLHEIHPEIIYSTVNFSKKDLQISYRSENVKLSEIAKFVTQLGYKPSINLQTFDKTESKRDNGLLLKIGVAGFCFGNIMLLAFPEYTLPFSNTSPEAWLEGNKEFFRWGMFLLSLPVMFFAATDYFKSAWLGIKHRYINIDLPIAIGFWVLFLRSTYDIVLDISPGFFDTIAGLAFFMLIGKWFQQQTYKSLAFDRDYKSFYPIAVVKISNGIEEPTLVADLKIGDRIVIRNEEIIPADAILIKGEAMIDNSFVTGESRLISKNPGDKIFAGGKQSGTALELEIIKEVDQSYLTQLWNNEAFRKVESGLNRLTNTISRYFVWTILSIAIASGVFWYFRDSTQVLQVVTAILIITCPCALALSSPFILGNVMRIFGEKKFYIKNTAVIESMAKLDEIILDKTGTITESQESGVEFVGGELTKIERKEIQSVLKNSGHPLSRILYKHLNEKEILPVSDYHEEMGKGQNGVVNGKLIKLGSRSFVGSEESKLLNQTQVFVSIDQQIKGKFIVQNSYRKGLENVIKGLDNYGLTVLSGDNDSEKEKLETIFPIQTQLLFYQSPEDKLAYVRNVQDEGKEVLMLGDGLNDSGALKQSDVGVVISEDVNNFSPSCDAILDAKAFDHLPQFLRFSKLAIRLIWIAFLISFLYNIVGLGFSISGNLEPVVAAILMPISSISVVIFATLSTRIASKFVFKNLE